MECMPASGPGAAPLSGGDDQQGFTLVELTVVMSIVAVLSAIATFGFANQLARGDQQGSTQRLVAALRALSVQAVSEGRTYCIALDDRTPATLNRNYQTWRYSCGGVSASSVGVPTGPVLATQSPNVSFTATASPRPTYACPPLKVCIYFYPRGTADPAAITVRSTKRSGTYSISVQGLTARVF